MNHPMATRNKHRITLTETQIRYLLRLNISIMSGEELVVTSEDEDIATSIVSKLGPVVSGIDWGAKDPSYTVQPSFQEKLITSLGGQLIPEGMAKEDYWQDCYQKYINTPGDCTLQEINGAKEHMYLNGLMTPQQVALFEEEHNS
jgi:hypothetical protein